MQQKERKKKKKKGLLFGVFKVTMVGVFVTCHKLMTPSRKVSASTELNTCSEAVRETFGEGHGVCALTVDLGVSPSCDCARLKD